MPFTEIPGSHGIRVEVSRDMSNVNWLCSRVATADVRLTEQRVAGGVFDVHEK
ncbi:hypothetical protein ACIQZB_32080 [Streptomyces sp. NPDC097727]|uniref:hypothetical protein n=1 Tax=Streptomyces sp. NPDC097727 TaxID=3366092 RepID=UPI00381A9BC3